MWLLLSAVAFAQPLEAYIGPERSTGRVIGMGGAHVAVAESFGARPDNPATFAARRPLRSDMWTQIHAEAGAAGTDFLRAQPLSPVLIDADRPDTLLHGAVALRLGPTGFGLHATRMGFAFSDPEGYAQLQHGTFGGGAGFAAGDFVFGALAQLHYATLTVGETHLFGRRHEGLSLGVGLQAGAVWAPAEQPWRLGARLGPPVRVVPIGDLPRSVDMVVPPSGALGASWSTRRNVTPTYGRGDIPERGGRYLLIAADLEVTGPSNGAPIGSLARERPAGAPTTVSLQLGAEAEVLERLLTLRVGGYNEPGRYADESARMHVTGGASVFAGELPHVGGLRLSAGVDVAPGWAQVGFGFGAW